MQLSDSGTVRAGWVCEERVCQLFAVAVWDRITLDADRPEQRTGSMERAERVIPQHPELAEVHLCVREALTVVPAVDFSDTDEVAQRPQDRKSVV